MVPYPMLFHITYGMLLDIDDGIEVYHMKKLVLLLIIPLLVIITACSPEARGGDDYILPDITNFSKDEIQIVFDRLDISVVFFYRGEATNENQLQFIEYGHYLKAGDSFDRDSDLPVIIYPEFELDNYFSITNLDYDGPLLSESFGLIDPVDPRGGYFEVTLSNCIDGDTAKFTYPSYIYDAILNFSNNTRFLNMDTEETYGTPEEWGKPGSVYTCSLLTEAESIVLQTDPNDGLIDNDDYRRLLAWIWVKLPNEEEYFLLNYMVVQQGLAQVKYEFGSGETIRYNEITYNEWMHIAEDYAIENNLGQWGDQLDYYWDYDTKQPDYSKWN